MERVLKGSSVSEHGEEAEDCVYFNFKCHLVCAYLGCGDGGKILLALNGDGHSENSPTLMNAMFSIIKSTCVHLMGHVTDLLSGPSCQLQVYCLV